MKPCDIGLEAAERYVAGSMDESERTSFEDHFFACEDCFFTVQSLETARGVLAGGPFTAEGTKAGGVIRGSGRGLPLQWMAAAAALVVVVGLSVMTRQRVEPRPSPSRCRRRSTRASGRGVNISAASAGSSGARSERTGSIRAPDERGQARAMGPSRSSAVRGADDALRARSGRRRERAAVR